MGGVALLFALGLTVGACGAGTATHTDAAATAAHPTSSTNAGNGSATAGSLAATVATPAPTTAPTTSKPTAKAVASKPHVATTPTVAAPATPAVAPTAVTTPAPTTPTLPARTQPTAAEVNQVIATVHSLFPLFTPTPAQIAQVGNEVCTAFDQGKTVAQVKTAAMQVAGVYASLIPPNVVNTAVHTIVSLYCPGYTSKLS